MELIQKRNDIIMSTQPEETYAEATKLEYKRPPLYKVILHNDDYTPMEFVVYILETIFHKTNEEANQLMMNVHINDATVCGVYPHGIAETKVVQVLDMAEQNEYPLKCTLEKE